MNQSDINPLDNIRIVLVETSHPGNIGAAARAMKTMGLGELYLVNPALYPNAEATARASGADDLLARAVVSDSLDAALKDCTLVVGSSARLRTRRWPQLKVRIVHRTGLLEVGDTSVLIAVASPHRAEGFEALRYSIDTIKETVPIWKKEIYTDGHAWIEGS